MELSVRRRGEVRTVVWIPAAFAHSSSARRSSVDVELHTRLFLRRQNGQTGLDLVFFCTGTNHRLPLFTVRVCVILCYRRGRVDGRDRPATGNQPAAPSTSCGPTTTWNSCSWIATAATISATSATSTRHLHRPPPDGSTRSLATTTAADAERHPIARLEGEGVLEARLAHRHRRHVASGSLDQLGPPFRGE